MPPRAAARRCILSSNDTREPFEGRFYGIWNVEGEGVAEAHGVLAKRSPGR